MGCSSSRPEKKEPVYQKSPEPDKQQQPEPEATRTMPVDDDQEEEEALAPLSSELKERVMKLFKEYDEGGKGEISIAKLQDTTVQLGPTDFNPLEALASMDLDGDGFVQASEWETYFTMLYATSPGDTSIIDALLGDLRQANETLLAKSAFLAAAADADADYGAVDESEMEQYTLTDEQKKLVDDLYSVWDFNGDGEIDLEALKTSGFTVGPQAVDVFKKFEEMDIDGDKKVSKQEMYMYFGVAASLFASSPEQFKESVEMLMNAATIEKSIEQGLKYNAEYMDAQGGDEEAEEELQIEEMPEERVKAVTDLFKIFSDDLDKPIKIADILEAKLENGPQKIDVFDTMKAMDVNNDGMVEFGEMKFWFQAVSAGLDDASFMNILEALKDSAETRKAIKIAKEMQQ